MSTEGCLTLTEGVGDVFRGLQIQLKGVEVPVVHSQQSIWR
jgi:hypothetical protein